MCIKKLCKLVKMGLSRTLSLSIAMYDTIEKKCASREVSGIEFLLTLRASSRVLGGESARRGHQALRTLITYTAVPLCTEHKHRKINKINSQSSYNYD